MPGDEARARVGALVAGLGERELAGVEATAGPDWSTTLHQLAAPSPRERCRRVLGLGHATTVFLAEPAGLTASSADRVGRLGARANLLVTLFARLTDRGLAPDEVLDPALLDRDGPDAPGPDRPRGTGPVGRTVARLVDDYFRRIGSLPHAASRPGVVAALLRRIRRMHEEQRRVAAEPALREQAHLVRSVYPFVVMGLPGWLAAPSFDVPRFREVLGWLHRVGGFLRWIDDAADLAEDAASGSHNVVAPAREAAGDDRVIAELIDRGRALLRARRGWPTVESFPSEAAFGTCLDRWLGDEPPPAARPAPSGTG